MKSGPRRCSGDDPAIAWLQNYRAVVVHNYQGHSQALQPYMVI
jgi:hypothetical protein